MAVPSVTDWITAAATTIGLIAAGAAAYFAFRAFRLEQRRDARAEASAFAPWWARRTGPAGEEWGPVLTNSSGRVMRDVIVSTKLRRKSGEWVPILFEMVRLPPGQYFTRSRHHEPSWPVELIAGEPRPVPIAVSDTHQVLTYRLRDSTGQRWDWEPDRGLRRSGATRSDRSSPRRSS